MIYILLYFQKIIAQTFGDFFCDFIVNWFWNQEKTLFSYSFRNHLLIFENVTFDLGAQIGDDFLMIIFTEKIFDPIAYDWI